MHKALVSLSFMALVLFMTGTSFAVDTVIGDFENGSVDLFSLTWEEGITIGPSDIGATSGTGSLAISCPVDLANNFKWAILANVEPGLYDAVQLDLTWVASDWVGEGGWAQMVNLAVNSDAGWMQIDSVSDTVRGDDFPGNWDSSIGDYTTTLTWDISGVNPGDSPWMQVIFSTNNGGFTEGGKYYIDNVKLLGGRKACPDPTIIWVSEAIDRDVDGNQDDQGWVDMLNAAGYNVDVRLDHWRDLEGVDANDANDYVGELNAADLVIVSRAANSGNYDDGNEPTLWNSITSPMILMSSHIARNSRWLWFNSADLLELLPAETELTAPDHPMFDGLTSPVSFFDPNVGSGSSNFFVVTDAGNGSVLATGDGLVQIAEWAAGTEFYADANQWAGGDRVFFTAGTQEVGGEQPQGAMNLNADGQQVFLAAVDNLIPEPPLVENASFEEPGTGKIRGWDGENTRDEPAVDVPGWNTDSPPYDSGVESGWAPESGENGVWSGFLMDSDPSLWQLTCILISDGDEITLTVDARDNWNGSDQPTELEISLYYDGPGGARSPLGSTVVTPIADVWTTFELSVSVEGMPDAVGRNLGIEIDNITAADAQNWIGIDDVTLSIKPNIPGLTHSYDFEDGTATDLVGDADGTLVGGAVIVDGALLTTAQDQWLALPGDVIDINSYDEVTLEAWYTPEAGGNASWSMLAYFGGNANGVGGNGLFITTARGDDVSRAAISVGDLATPWASESGANGPEYDDGLLHHMVGTFNGDVVLYIDGAETGRTATSDTNVMSGLSNDLALLAKGGYDGDPEWIGQIHSFNIYNRAITPGEVAALYAGGPN